jgi:DhnA family fructose-bisphosphate aldolase class Ia
MLHLLGPAFLDDIVALTDRSPRVLRSLQAVFDHGRLAGTGLITGRKAFQRPMKEGIALLNAVQDVYLDRDITVA